MSENPPMTPSLVSRYRGCLLAGAAGDALGAPVEFWRRDQIVTRFGEPGITDYIAACGRRGAITDDTQMSLFTAEGLLQAERTQAAMKSDVGNLLAHRQAGAEALQRWLLTQGGHSALTTPTDTPLFAESALHSRRAPGNTCL